MKKELLLLFLLISTNVVFSQQTINYFGTSTNSGGGGVIDLQITISTNGDVTGYVINDGYPGNEEACGEGEISGTKNGNQLELQYTSFDPDPGCGVIDGTELFYFLTASSDLQILSGTWNHPTSQENGTLHLRTESECPDISSLTADYQSKIGTPEELYAKQYLCLAEKTCLENNINGENGWAANFVKYMFDYMGTHNQGNTGSDFDCFSFTTNEVCFSAAGSHHYWIELRPAFFNYCYQVDNQTDIDRWTTDHESFITDAIDACFDEQIIDEETCTNLPQSLCAVYLTAAKELTKWLVRNLREEAQAYCQNNLNNGDIFDLATLIPDALTSNELFSTELDDLSEISISTDSFFLAVGESYQLTSILDDGSGTNVTNASTGTEYFLNVDNSIASLSVDGLLTINSTDMPLVSSRQPFYVFAKNGDNIGIGQFSIFDIDTDGDLLVDSYETKINLNPNFNNGLYYDIDSDGLIDFLEALVRTDPWSNDSDSDGFSDSFEIGVRTDPLDPSSTPTSITTGILFVDFFDSKVEVSPNPFDNRITLKFSSDLNGFKFDRISVINTNGQLIYQENHNRIERENYEIKLGEIPQGIYLIQLLIENQVVTKKVIKR